MNPNETIADILREMMNCTAVKSKVPHSTVEDTLNPPIIRFDLEHRAIVRDFAYRIAAAEERSKTSGSSAAMREALEWVAEFVELGVDDEHGMDGQNLTIAAEKARSALSAPARNCDICRTKREAKMEYDSRHNAEYGSKDDFIDWLFRPAEGGDHA